MFDSEVDLVTTSIPLVLKEFKCNNKKIDFIEEPKGLFGVPDLLLFNGSIIAIEFKLKNWKQAIKQAYRYKSFSDESYVLMDKECVFVAKKNIDIFTRFNIGLGGVDNQSIEFYYKPEFNKPFSYDLTQKVLELFSKNKE